MAAEEALQWPGLRLCMRAWPALELHAADSYGPAAEHHHTAAWVPLLTCFGRKMHACILHPSACMPACPYPAHAVAALLCAGTVNVQRNENFGKLRAGYLFPEVQGQHAHACTHACTHTRTHAQAPCQHAHSNPGRRCMRWLVCKHAHALSALICITFFRKSLIMWRSKAGMHPVSIEPRNGRAACSYGRMATCD